MDKKKSIWNNTLFCAAILLGCGIVWGGGYIAQKISLEDAGMSPEAIMFAREFLATILIFACFPKRIMKSYRKGEWKGGAIGAAFFVAGTMFQTYGLSNTTPGVAGFLTSTSVVIVPLIWWLIKKEKPSNVVLLCCLLALVGIGFLSFNEGFAIKPADLMVLVCAFLFSGYVLSISAFARDTDPIVLSFLLFLFSTIMSFVLFMINDGNWAQFFTKPAILSILYLAVLFTFLSNTLQVFAQAHIRPGLAAILLSMESLFAALFGILFGYDSITFKFLVGGFLMLLAVMLPSFDEYFKEKKELKAEKKQPSTSAT